MRVSVITYFVFLYIAFALPLSAQRINIYKALNYDKLQLYDSARICIDSALVHPETKDDIMVQYYRGFIYKNLYVYRDKKNKKSIYRDEALRDFFHFLEVNTSEALNPPCVKTIDFLLISLYNDAVTSMYSNQIELALKLWEKYITSYKKLHPEKNTLDTEIQFYKSLATVYSDAYDSSKTEVDFNKAEQAYVYILSKDSNNWSANYNLGVLYYNKMTSLVKQQGYDDDLNAILEMQERMTPLMKQALPYLKKAYELNPKHRETLVGLAEIYYNFYEYELSDRMKLELKLLDGK